MNQIPEILGESRLCGRALGNLAKLLCYLDQLEVIPAFRSRRIGQPSPKSRGGSINSVLSCIELMSGDRPQKQRLDKSAAEHSGGFPLMVTQCRLHGTQVQSQSAAPLLVIDERKFFAPA
jgi:hypothetical protein